MCKKRGIWQCSNRQTGITTEIETKKHSFQQLKDFLKFVAGRRGTVTLGKVLTFVTCGEQEPVLGYAIPPSLLFSDSLPSCLPKQQNKLVLAIGEKVQAEKEEMFYRFDLAFLDTYFGMV